MFYNWIVAGLHPTDARLAARGGGGGGCLPVVIAAVLSPQ